MGGTFIVGTFDHRNDDKKKLGPPRGGQNLTRRIDHVLKYVGIYLQKFNFNKTYFFFLRQIQLIPESK
jgi:hypothetical protein